MPRAHQPFAPAFIRFFRERRIARDAARSLSKARQSIRLLYSAFRCTCILPNYQDYNLIRRLVDAGDIDNFILRFRLRCRTDIAVSRVERCF
jgi:hypothetical protein